jgi:predicted RND superfamily exporter protein
MTRIPRFISEKAPLLIVLLLILGVWPLLQLSRIRFDNSIDVWLDHQSREYQDYQEFIRDYGSDDWILIAFSIQGVPREKALADLLALSEHFEKMEEGVKAVSIANSTDPAVAVLKPLLLSKDEQTVSILLQLPRAVQQDRSALLDKIEHALASYPSSYTFHLGGPTVLNVELDRSSKHQARLLFTLAVILSVMGLFVVFRSVRYVLVVVIASGFVVLWTLGIAASLGMTLNMITTVLPVLLWVYSLTGSIHVIYQIRLRYNAEEGLLQAILGALQSVLFPYTIAYLTTAVGFLALLTSHMQPVRDLGLFAALGIGISFCGNLVLIPGMLKLMDKKTLRPVVSGQRPSRVLASGISSIRKWKGAIVLTGFFFFFLPSLLLPSMKVESNVLTFFKQESRILKDYTFITNNLAGASTIELDFRGFPLDTWGHASRLAEELKDIPGIQSIVYLAPPHLRMTIVVKPMESMAFNKLVKDIRSRMTALESRKVKARLTGTVVLINQVQETLLYSQIKSFGLAFFIIFIVFIFIFRSFILVTIGIGVNLFPIAVLSCFMAIFRIPLNVATVMIASIAIGIAVDDTVYFLRRFRFEFQQEGDWEGSIQRAYLHLARPMTFTSLVTTLGFLILVLANFKPISFFGLLGGVTLTAAWAGDVILSPALLYLTPSRLRKV